MDRAYVYNKVRSLLAVFVAFEVLNDEDKKTRKGKDKAMDKKKGWKGIFQQHREGMGDRRHSRIELKIWCEWVMPIFNEYWATSNRILLENKNKIVLLCYRLCIHGDHGYVFLIAHVLAQQYWKNGENDFNSASAFRTFQRTKEMLTHILKAFKLFQHRFNIASTRFNNVERGGKRFQHCHSTKSKGCWSKCWSRLLQVGPWHCCVHFSNGSTEVS